MTDLPEVQDSPQTRSLKVDTNPNYAACHDAIFNKEILVQYIAIH